MYVKLSWRPEVDQNLAIMVVQPAILTYPTIRKVRKNNVLYYPEYSSRFWHPILAP
jgi:hypothetical protein